MAKRREAPAPSIVTSSPSLLERIGGNRAAVDNASQRVLVADVLLHTARLATEHVLCQPALPARPGLGADMDVHIGDSPDKT